LLHRITWIALPIVGVVVLGSGLGWWGYQQYQQKQSMALQADAGYAGAFQSLRSDMNLMREELGKSTISSSSSILQSRLREIWRLSYGAQTEIGKLPLSLMPMHNVQSFLSNVSTTSDKWLDSNALPTTAVVHHELERWYGETASLGTQLENIQNTIWDKKETWQHVNEFLTTKKKGDNQIIDGFHNIDTGAVAYVEKDTHPSSSATQRNTKPIFTSKFENRVKSADALRVFYQFTGLSSGTPLKVSQMGKGASELTYLIQERNATKQSKGEKDAISGLVTQSGGHVIQFHIPLTGFRNPLDFVSAQQQVSKWLTKHGFGSVEMMSGMETEDEAQFVFIPVYHGALVTPRTIHTTVSLKNGQIIGFDATSFYRYPTSSGIPSFVISTQNIRARVSPYLKVQMTRKVYILDSSKEYTPAIAVYGILNGETYCQYFNAVTGKEMMTEQLSKQEVT